MEWKLNYGDGATLPLALGEMKLVHDFTAPRGVPNDDPAACVAAALTDPLDFPPLNRAIVPGDRVAIALDRGVPCAAEVLAGIAQCVFESGQNLDLIQVVIADDFTDAANNLRQALSPALQERIEISVHDPADRTGLAYLAASEEGKPIYLNRILCDADVVLPVSASRLPGSLGFLGVYGGLFPTFSDEAMQQRFRAPSSNDFAVHQRRRRAEVEEAAWLLGVQFSIQIIPGPGESLLEAVAGESHAVAAESHRRTSAAWLHPGVERAELVIAGIEGEPHQQNWDSFARALFAASRAVVEDGAVLLCTGLDCHPGPALQRLLAAESDERALYEIRRDRSYDALSATLLTLAKQHARIYLLSNLDRELVEDLGLGHVTGAADVERLAHQFSSCILLGSAQHAQIDFEVIADVHRSLA